MAKLLNNLLSSFFAFFLFFTWTRILSDSIFLSLVIGSLFCICTSAILSMLSQIPSKKEFLAKEKAQRKSLAFFLATTKSEDIFEKLLKNNNYDCISRQPFGFFATKNNEQFAFLLFFKLEKFSLSKMAEFFKHTSHCSKHYVFCNEFEKNVFEIKNFSDCNLEVFNVDEIFDLLKNSNLLPLLKNTSIPKPKPKIFYLAFERKRFFYWFFAGTFMLLSSSFSFIPIYTLIWATLFFLGALFCIVNKKYNVSSTKSI